jgi:hypothetical protein
LPFTIILFCIPGNIKTELHRNFKLPLLSMMLYPAEIGVLTQLYAATSEEAKDYGGKVG